MRKDSGGPAFPVPDTYHPNGQVEFGATGMTLRDYMMIHAPAKEITLIEPLTAGECADLIGIQRQEYDGGIHYMQVRAKLRAMWADAMLAERVK